MSTDPHQNPERINLARVLPLSLATPVLMALLMFGAAGTISWTRGWLFLVIFCAAMCVAALYLARVNPELIAARSRWHGGMKRWDIVLVTLLFAGFFAIMIVAALDDGRFHWLPVAWWVCVLGYVLLVCGYAGLTWASAVNKFFETTVRIQTDRGQTVIQTGPYAIVRHPGYASALPMFVGMALGMGSLWALIPAALTWAVLILRARGEDALLQTELPGYKEYAQKVRYKMIPRVW